VKVAEEARNGEGGLIDSAATLFPIRFNPTIAGSPHEHHDRFRSSIIMSEIMDFTIIYKEYLNPKFSLSVKSKNS
jgi:hypothetical protein